MYDQSQPDTNCINEFTDAISDLFNDPAELLKYWEEVSKRLDTLKELEIELRNKLITHYFPHNPHDLPEGTHYHQLTPTTRLKCVFRISHTLTKDEEELQAATLSLSLQNYDWERLIKFSPKLSLTEYNKLTPHLKNIIDKVVTTKPAQAVIEIVEDK